MQQYEVNGAAQEEEGGPSLVDYLHVLVSRGRMIAGVTFAVMCLTAAYSLTKPNVYTAKAMILPMQEDKGMMSAVMNQLGGLAGLAAGSVGATNTTDLYLALLKSELVMDPLIDRFKLKEKEKAKFRSDLYGTLGDRITAAAGKKDGIITITVTDASPRTSADMANFIVDELSRCILDINVGGAGRNRAFLGERLAKAKGELAHAEDELKEFQTRSKTIAVTEQAKASIEGIARLKAELATQEVQLNTMRLTFTEDAPELRKAASVVTQLRGQIARMEGSGSGGALPSMGAAPALGQEYLRRMREFKGREALVELLTKQYELALLNESKTVTPFQIVRKATPPERKSAPARAKMVLASGAVAFFLSSILAFVLENVARMNEADLERWKSVLPRRRARRAVLAGIPAVEG